MNIATGVAVGGKRGQQKRRRSIALALQATHRLELPAVPQTTTWQSANHLPAAQLHPGTLHKHLACL